MLEDCKILVTVGTTSWNELCSFLDKELATSYDITFQIADGNYKPINGPSVDFVDNFDEYLNQFNIIITHAGAGNVYGMLEKGRTLVVVPNLHRIDKHQIELARFLDGSKYCFVAFEFSDIADSLLKSFRSALRPYKKEPFFLFNKILTLDKSNS